MYFTYDHKKVYYEKTGIGPPIILLHGWGSSSSVFEYLTKGIKKKYTVYRIDLPGFGQSEEPPHAYHLDDYVLFLRTFIEQLEITTPILLGHSFGGRISIRYTSRYQDVKQLILVDSAGVKPKGHFKTKLKIYGYKIKKRWYKMTKNVSAYQRLVTHSGSSDYQNATPILKQTLSYVVNEFLEQDLKQIDIDTLLIWGKEDQTTPYEEGIKMNRLIKQSGLVTIQKAGHFPFIDEPYAFYKILYSYLGVNT